MDKNNKSSQQNFFPLIFQQNIAPGVIKQQHLLPSPTRAGDLYYGKDGVNFSNLKIGSTGQILMVIAGVPAWVSFPQTGIATARPTSGRFTGDQWYSTDTKVFSLWDGSTWRTTTLT